MPGAANRVKKSSIESVKLRSKGRPKSRATEDYRYVNGMRALHDIHDTNFSRHSLQYCICPHSHASTNQFSHRRS